MRNNKKIIALIIILAVLLAALVAAAIVIHHREEPVPPAQTTGPETVMTTEPSAEPSSEPTEPSTEPTEPPITKIATATISSVGDMLMHEPVFQSGYNSATGEYELDMIFRYFYDYVTSADLAVGNLETTLAGDDNGFAYHGYPNFNCPDSIIDSMKNAGFDLILTANNHSYDTGSIGLSRTLEVVRDRELMYLGTKQDAEEPNYIIADCNGIRIGLMCYTYETGTENPDTIALNGAPLSVADSKLVNAFSYSELPAFYAEMEENIADMEANGAEAVMLFIHWGDEYDIEGNRTQKQMAQTLCDLGVDVIVGGHPHVVQPVELLTSAEDENHKTLCLYSMGNAVSNQRKERMNLKTGHTEDGVMFSITFAEYSDGTVIIEDADILPFWVDRRYNADWVREYYMLPLDTEIEDWKTQFDLSDDTLAQAQASYERTMAIVGKGMEEADAYYAANQQAVEEQLGVQ